MDVPLIDFGVMWSKGFLVRDVGWEYMAVESCLLGLFSIHVFVRLRDDLMIYPLGIYPSFG